MKSVQLKAAKLHRPHVLVGSSLLSGILIAGVISQAPAQTATPAVRGKIANPRVNEMAPPPPPIPGEGLGRTLAGPPAPGPLNLPPVPGPLGPSPGRPADMRERAYRGAVEFSRYNGVKGEASKLMDQARDYYGRSGEMLKKDNQDESVRLASISEHLVQSALHLVRSERGPVPEPKVAGWEPPARLPEPEPPAEDTGQNPRVLNDLDERLANAPDAPAVSPWVASARGLLVQAKRNFSAKRYEAGREQAHAAMHLLDAAALEADRSH